MLACASMTFPLSRHARPRPKHPGQQSPYFSDASRAGKAELVFLDPRMRKHDGEREARMTAGGVSLVMGSFTSGDKTKT